MARTRDSEKKMAELKHLQHVQSAERFYTGTDNTQSTPSPPKKNTESDFEETMKPVEIL